MIKKIIKEKIYQTVNTLYRDLQINASDIDIVESKKIEHGDYATNFCMKFSKTLNQKPIDLAELIVAEIKKNDDFFDNVDFIKPGFINFKVKASIFNDTLLNIYRTIDSYGSGDTKKGKILLEYVSANPTGFLHLGHLRNAAVGDSICRILRFYGHDVDSEYYINDFGNQIKLLGKSLGIRVRNLHGENIEMPEDAYLGDYLVDIAKKYSSEFSQDSLDSDKLENYAKDYLLQEIKNDLASLNIKFDNWYSESKSIHNSGLLDEILDKLSDLNVLYDKDDAKWIKTSEYGDSNDWVLIKSDKSSTYFLSDIAYHYDKFNRGYDKVINVWGSDHHSHVSRLKASMNSLNNKEKNLYFVMIQFVRLLKDGKDISMSKRSGQYTTIKDLLSLVDNDVVRFMMVTRSSDTHFDFDLDQCLKDSDENPVFYIQYANARINSIIKKSGIKDLSTQNLDIIDSIKEVGLIKAVIDFEDVIKDSAENLAPHKLTFYLQNLAKEFHSYYKSTKILNNDKLMTRLILITTIKSVLSNGLSLLGVSSPEEM